ncbi:MAG: tetratricopeptide repeat protein, partial [Nitrosomonadales bacterium]|nr:tetratricopeptide repeat protein [Nitrosomonadales bacterium]
MSSISRNDPCPCGSGKKYKKCCAGKFVAAENSPRQTGTSKGVDFNATNVSPPSDRLLKAVALHQEGQLDKAKETYQALLRENPDGGEAMHYLHYLGMIEHQEGRYPEAASLIERAIKRQGNIPVFHCNLANAYIQSGRLDSALNSYHEAIRLAPRFPQAYFNLHALLLDQTNVAPAIECMQKAVEIAPENLIFRFHLGMLLDYSGMSDIAAKHLEMVENGDDLCRALL